MDHLAGYFEVDKGRFESALVRRSDRTVIAYTHGDEVIVTVSGLGIYDNADRKAVVAYAEQYDLSIRW